MERLPEERRLEILAELRQASILRVADVADRYGVSSETVRRDFLDLERSGVARRVYGGLARPTAGTEAPFEHRMTTNLQRKQAIARLAVTLLRPGERLTLDIGTSVAEVARALPADHRGQVLTNSLLAAVELSGRAGVDVLCAGGHVRPGDLALHGTRTEAFYRDFHGGTAFLGSGGVHPKAGLTDYHEDEIAARRVIIERADRRYVLADSGKLGHIAPERVCGLDAITAVITDDGVDAQTARRLEDAGVTLLVAPA